MRETVPWILAIALVFPIAKALAQNSTGAEAPQEDIFALPTEEVSAYRVPVQLRETSQGVSIVTQREIAARNPAAAIDLLQQLPGVQIDQVGNAGGLGNVYIRGSEPNHTLILIDGVRVNDPTNNRGGGYDLSTLDAASIERIEVIRGAASALYGADGLGGIINIVTKRGKAGGFKGSVAGGIGGQDYRQAQTSLSLGGAKVQSSFSASVLKDGRKEDGGDLDLTSFHGTLAFQPSENSDIRFYARHNDRESTGFPEFSGGIRFAENRELETRDAEENIYGVDAWFEPWNKVELTFKLATYHRLEDKNSPAVAPAPDNPFSAIPASVSRIDFERQSALASALFRLPLNSDLTVGFEHLREVGENRGALDFGFGPPQPTDFNLTRKTNSPFAEFKIKPIENLVGLVGVRHDSISDQDSETSSSAGIRFTIPGSQTTLKAHYAEAFKPPSFFALGDPFTGEVASEPVTGKELVSETSKGSEIGVEQRFWENRGLVGVSVFRNRIKNLIDFNPDTFLIENRDRVKADGVEAEFRLRPIDSLTFSLNYTYVDLEIEDSDAKLRNRPEHRAGLAVYYTLNEAWQFGVNATYVGKVFDSSNPTGEVELDAYTRVDVTASYKWKQLTATFAIDNLLNDNYEQFVGFENPGIRARVGLGYSF